MLVMVMPDPLLQKVGQGDKVSEERRLNRGIEIQYKEREISEHKNTANPTRLVGSLWQHKASFH